MTRWPNLVGNCEDSTKETAADREDSSLLSLQGLHRHAWGQSSQLRPCIWKLWLLSEDRRQVMELTLFVLNNEKHLRIEKLNSLGKQKPIP